MDGGGVGVRAFVEMFRSNIEILNGFQDEGQLESGYHEESGLYPQEKERRPSRAKGPWQRWGTNDSGYVDGVEIAEDTERGMSAASCQEWASCHSDEAQTTTVKNKGLSKQSRSISSIAA